MRQRTLDGEASGEVGSVARPRSMESHFVPGLQAQSGVQSSVEPVGKNCWGGGQAALRGPIWARIYQESSRSEPRFSNLYKEHVDSGFRVPKGLPSPNGVAHCQRKRRERSWHPSNYFRGVTAFPEHLYWFMSK